LKLKIDTILPIAVAGILPLLSFYSNSEIEINGMKSFLIRWLSIAIFIYIEWQLLWKISDIKSKYRTWGYVVIFMVLALTTYGLKFLQKDEFEFQHIFRLIFTMVLILLIQYALKSQQNISGLIIEKEQLQKENYKSQLKLLRTQIDPHFLFNSLNTLRSMVRHQHFNSEKFIMCLSDFYRQTMKNNENTSLPLSEEIEVLKSYLFLMTNRNEEAVKTKFDINDSFLSFHLPSLALQVVVENCFKHNSMTSKMPLHIKVETMEDFFIKISNNIQPKIGDNNSTGFGLNSLKKRYELMKISEGVIIEKTANQFSIKLKLIKK